ncbi:N-acetyltransferase family protein [Chryseolinea sp. T2]|uniref:GNAT family N-acetyltransferase n=1 Tax=Chryseolinea sp. T2 TaxID=3129255 RepID=UPI003077E8AB
MDIQLIPVRDEHLDAIREIYQYYVDHSTATFHTGNVTSNELREKILINHPKYRSFVVEADGLIRGYCYLSQYNKRQAYDRTAELSIYLSQDFQGRGAGREVLRQLEDMAKDVGIVVLLAIISGDNEQSIRMFATAGYFKCGELKEVGEKFGRMLNVVFYQKILI